MVETSAPAVEAFQSAVAKISEAQFQSSITERERSMRAARRFLRVGIVASGIEDVPSYISRLKPSESDELYYILQRNLRVPIAQLEALGFQSRKHRLVAR